MIQVYLKDFHPSKVALLKPLGEALSDPALPLSCNLGGYMIGYIIDLFPDIIVLQIPFQPYKIGTSRTGRRIETRRWGYIVKEIVHPRIEYKVIRQLLGELQPP